MHSNGYSFSSEQLLTQILLGFNLPPAGKGCRSMIETAHTFLSAPRIMNPVADGGEEGARAVMQRLTAFQVGLANSATFGRGLMMHLALLIANAAVFFSDRREDCPKLASFVFGFFIFAIFSVLIMSVRTIILFKEIDAPAKRWHSWLELFLQVLLIAGCAYTILGTHPFKTLSCYFIKCCIYGSLYCRYCLFGSGAGRVPFVRSVFHVDRQRGAAVDGHVLLRHLQRADHHTRERL
jgi:hypothetical protein